MKRSLSIALLATLLCCGGAHAEVTTVKVLDPDGKPVAGAQVQIMQFSSLALAESVLTSDAAGTVTLETKPPQSPGGSIGRAVVWATGLAIGGKLLRGGTNTIRLSKPTALSGCVVDTQGKPVADAALYLRSVYSPYETGAAVRDDAVSTWLREKAADVFSTRTDAQGQWTLKGLPLKVTAQVALHDTRFASVTVQATVGENAIAPDLVARPGAVLQGRIVDAAGRPVAGVRVFPQAQQEQRNNDGWTEAKSGSDGRYSLIGLLKGTFSVLSQPDPKLGLVGAAIEGAQAIEGQSTPLKDIVLGPGALVIGTVQDAQSGKPLEGALIGYYGPHSPRSSAAVLGAQSGLDGKFQLRLAPGTASVCIVSPPKNYLSAIGMDGIHFDVVLKTGETKILTFKLPHAPVLAGVAVDDNGQPVEGAEIYAGAEGEVLMATSGKDGKWKIEGLRPGQKNLTTRGKWDIVAPKTVRLAAGGNVAGDAGEIVLKLHAVQVEKVIGRVLNTHGKPISGVQLRLSAWLIDPHEETNETHITDSQATSDAAGRFELPPIRSGCRVEVTASKAGYQWLSGGAVTHPQKEMLGVNGQMVPTPDQPYVVEDFVFAALSESAKGRVVDEAGEPVAGAWVFALGCTPRTQTDAHGEYTLPGLPANAALVAAKERTLGKADLVADGASDITLHPLPAEKQDIEGGKAVMNEILADLRWRYDISFFPSTLAPYDYEAALQYALTLNNGTIRDDVLADLIETLAYSDPSPSREHLEDLAKQFSPKATASQLATAARVLADSAPESAQELAGKAAAQLPAKLGANMGSDEITARLKLAALEARLQVPGAPAGTQAGKLWAALGKPGLEPWLFHSLTHETTEFIESALAHVREAQRAEALNYVMPDLAKRDLAGARRLLETIAASKGKEDDESRGMRYGYSSVALQLMPYLAKADPQAALDLARQVKGTARSRALAIAASVQPKEEALPLLHEAFELALAGQTDPMLRASIAANAWKVDAATGRSMFEEVVRTSQSTNGMDDARTNSIWNAGGTIVPLARRLAPLDAAWSRVLLEAEWTRTFPQPKNAVLCSVLGQIAAAMRAVDTQRALEMVRAIPLLPDDWYSPHAKAEAMHDVATWLLTPPEKRDDLPLNMW